jgi:hypothetical protein
MDRQTLAIFIPILIFSVPVVAIVFNGLIRLAKIRAEGHRGVSGEAMERIADLEHHVQDLQRQLSETQERLDFAERLLARPKDRVS